MKKGRKQWSARLKARIALEALKEQKTLAELSSKYEVSANMISKWKSLLIKGSEKIFAKGYLERVDDSGDKEISKLYEELGRRDIELSWLKKKMGYIE